MCIFPHTSWAPFRAKVPLFDPVQVNVYTMTTMLLLPINRSTTSPSVNLAPLSSRLPVKFKSPLNLGLTVCSRTPSPTPTPLLRPLTLTPTLPLLQLPQVFKSSGQYHRQAAMLTPLAGP